MTAEEYLALGETPDRTELIQGVVVMSPSPLPRHSWALEELIGQLRDARARGLVVDTYIETDLKIDHHSVLRPDLSAYARPRPALAPDRLTDAPDLVIEILSPGTEAYDLITKKDEYERRGVREYWVIDPRDARVRAWHKEGSRLIESLVEGPTLPSQTLLGPPAFTLDLTTLAKALAIGPPPTPTTSAD